MKHFFGTDGKIVSFTPGAAGINHQLPNGQNKYLLSIASMLSDNKNMYQELAGVPKFISTWNTENLGGTGSATKTIVLPMTAGPEVDWGDGTVDNTNTHVYATGGIKTITIDDTNTDFRFNNGGDKIKILDVTQSNGLNITNTAVFHGCSNLVWTATDAPVISTTNLTNTFFVCFSLIGATGIPLWDVSSVQNFNQMFFGCSNFTAPIGVWNMSSAINIGGMFRAATNFNADINAWDVSNVQQMNHLFAGSSFNHDLNNWNVGKVTTTHAMFSSCPFNGDITGWTFTSTYVDSSWTFNGNTVFNRDISGWNMASVTNMSNMFNSASAFDQDLTGWNIGSVTNMSTMLNNCGLSQANYDNFLVMCAGQTIQTNVPLGAQGLTYTAAGAGGGARAVLITLNGWTITGDTGV